MTVGHQRVRVVEPMLAGGLELAVADDDEEQRWNDFVGSGVNATHCHRFQWKRVLEEAYNKPCYYLVARAEDRLVGLLPLVHMRGLLAGNRLVSLPFLDHGGILCRTDEQARLLLQLAQRVCERTGARGIDLRGGFRFGPEKPVATSRFTFALTLDSSEQLWKAIGPKVRNQIRKSQKSGLVTTASDPSRLPEFFAVFSENMHRLGSPTHSLGFFQSIFSNLGETVSLYLTEDATGAIVAGGVAIAFGDTFTVPWASSRLEARSSCPNHSLYWRILEDAVERGARAFDFGRSTEGTGTFHFKKQWNSQAIPLIWQSFDSSGAAVDSDLMSAHGSPRVARLWQRLPRAVADRVGPVLRRRLPN